MSDLPGESMRTLARLFEYNRWANRRVLEFCLARGEDELTREAPGTSGSIEATLKHLVGVEDIYLTMLRLGTLPPLTDADFDEYMRHDLAWFASRNDEVAEGIIALLGGVDGAFLDAPLNVPWFDFAMTKHDGLLQVVHHSAQHRAQVLSALGSRGVEGPDTDYVDMVGELTKQG